MKRFAGIATAAFILHSSAIFAQGVIVAPPDDLPGGRLERLPDGEMPRGPGRAERQAPQHQAPQQGLDGPAVRQRRAQSEGVQAPEPQRGQSAPREQTQRERPGQPSDLRAQEPQRGQAPQREQAQREQTQPRDQAQRERQNERSEPRNAEQPRPDARPTPQTAQPQRPESRPNASDTAQPGASPDERQKQGTTAQRPDATQPVAPGSEPAAGRATAARQPAEGSAADADKRRIADTVRERVERNELRPVENFGVSVSVGAELPSRVQLQPVPSEIAAIRPQYRDYRYSVSEHEIVIVDPRSRRVVEVIERGGGRRGDVEVYAAFEQRRDVRRWRRPGTVVFEQGVVLPSDAPYYDLPTEIVERNPRWRGYQYVMTERDEVAIVEPRSHRIVEVVDKSAARSAAAAPATTGSTTRQSAPGNGDSRHEIARIIMNDARPGEIQGVDGLKGAVLPREIMLRPIPAAASEQDRQLDGYQYTLLGDDVLIVDPQSREVIDVIE